MEFSLIELKDNVDMGIKWVKVELELLLFQK
jgi:hypothetical protein